MSACSTPHASSDSGSEGKPEVVWWKGAKYRKVPAQKGEKGEKGSAWPRGKAFRGSFPGKGPGAESKGRVYKGGKHACRLVGTPRGGTQLVFLGKGKRGKMEVKGGKALVFPDPKAAWAHLMGGYSVSGWNPQSFRITPRIRESPSKDEIAHEREGQCTCEAQPARNQDFSPPTRRRLPNEVFERHTNDNQGDLLQETNATGRLGQYSVLAETHVPGAELEEIPADLAHPTGRRTASVRERPGVGGPLPSEGGGSAYPLEPARGGHFGDRVPFLSPGPKDLGVGDPPVAGGRERFPYHEHSYPDSYYIRGKPRMPIVAQEGERDRRLEPGSRRLRLPDCYQALEAPSAGGAGRVSGPVRKRAPSPVTARDSGLSRQLDAELERLPQYGRFRASAPADGLDTGRHFPSERMLAESCSSERFRQSEDCDLSPNYKRPPTQHPIALRDGGHVRPGELASRLLPPRDAARAPNQASAPDAAGRFSGERALFTGSERDHFSQRDDSARLPIRTRGRSQAPAADRFRPDERQRVAISAASAAPEELPAGWQDLSDVHEGELLRRRWDGGRSRVRTSGRPATALGPRDGPSDQQRAEAVDRSPPGARYRATEATDTLYAGGQSTYVGNLAPVRGRARLRRIEDSGAPPDYKRGPSQHPAATRGGEHVRPAALASRCSPQRDSFAQAGAPDAGDRIQSEWALLGDRARGHLRPGADCDEPPVCASGQTHRYLPGERPRVAALAGATEFEEPPANGERGPTDTRDAEIPCQRLGGDFPPVRAHGSTATPVESRASKAASNRHLAGNRAPPGAGYRASGLADATHAGKQAAYVRTLSPVHGSEPLRTSATGDRPPARRCDMAPTLVGPARRNLLPADRPGILLRTDTTYAGGRTLAEQRKRRALPSGRVEELANRPLRCDPKVGSVFSFATSRERTNSPAGERCAAARTGTGPVADGNNQRRAADTYDRSFARQLRDEELPSSAAVRSPSGSRSLSARRGFSCCARCASGLQDAGCGPPQWFRQARQRCGCGGSARLQPNPQRQHWARSGRERSAPASKSPGIRARAAPGKQGKCGASQETRPDSCCNGLAETATPSADAPQETAPLPQEADLPPQHRLRPQHQSGAEIDATQQMGADAQGSGRPPHLRDRDLATLRYRGANVATQTATPVSSGDWQVAGTSANRMGGKASPPGGDLPTGRSNGCVNQLLTFPTVRSVATQPNFSAWRHGYQGNAERRGEDAVATKSDGSNSHQAAGRPDIVYRGSDVDPQPNCASGHSVAAAADETLAIRGAHLTPNRPLRPPTPPGEDGREPVFYGARVVDRSSVAGCGFAAATEEVRTQETRSLDCAYRQWVPVPPAPLQEREPDKPSNLPVAVRAGGSLGVAPALAPPQLTSTLDAPSGMGKSAAPQIAPTAVGAGRKSDSYRAGALPAQRAPSPPARSNDVAVCDPTSIGCVQQGADAPPPRCASRVDSTANCSLRRPWVAGSTAARSDNRNSDGDPVADSVPQRFLSESQRPAARLPTAALLPRRKVSFASPEQCDGGRPGDDLPCWQVAAGCASTALLQRVGPAGSPARLAYSALPSQLGDEQPCADFGEPTPMCAARPTNHILDQAPRLQAAGLRLSHSPISEARRAGTNPGIPLRPDSPTGISEGVSLPGERRTCADRSRFVGMEGMVSVARGKDAGESQPDGNCCFVRTADRELHYSTNELYAGQRRPLPGAHPLVRSSESPCNATPSCPTLCPSACRDVVSLRKPHRPLFDPLRTLSDGREVVPHAARPSARRGDGVRSTSASASSVLRKCLHVCAHGAGFRNPAISSVLESIFQTALEGCLAGDDQHLPHWRDLTESECAGIDDAPAWLFQAVNALLDSTSAPLDPSIRTILIGAQRMLHVM